MSAVELRAISDEDLPCAAAFLQEHMNRDIAIETWVRATTRTSSDSRPNAGFMLVASGVVVGVQLATYSERTLNGRRERFCALGPLQVLPEHRFHGLRLLKQVVGQEGYHFVDPCPNDRVAAIDEKLGFQALSSEIALIPNLPWPSRPGGCEISSDPRVLARLLDGEVLEQYRDHLDAPQSRHVVLREGGDACWVMLRRERRKRLPLFAHLLHVSDRALLRRHAAAFARHLLVRHGTVAQLVEAHVLPRPALAIAIAPTRRRMYRSASLRPGEVDYLYSELVGLPA